MTYNTTTELANNIGLRIADFSDGESRFKEALETAHSEIVFRLGRFAENSYPEKPPVDKEKYEAAIRLTKSAEWKRAGAILYRHKAQVETQLGDAGNIETTPDAFSLGAFTPNRLEVASSYKQRADELQDEYEGIMSLIAPNTNLPLTASASGRSNFSDNGTYWGKDSWT